MEDLSWEPMGVGSAIAVSKRGLDTGGSEGSQPLRRGGRRPKTHHQPRKQVEEPKVLGDSLVQGDSCAQGLGNKTEGKQCSLPDFIFLFVMQKKGSGFFFCAKHAPALCAAGAVLQECSPAPPVCTAPASPAGLHRSVLHSRQGPLGWGEGLRGFSSQLWRPTPCLCNTG